MLPRELRKHSGWNDLSETPWKALRTLFVYKRYINALFNYPHTDTVHTKSNIQIRLRFHGKKAHVTDLDFSLFSQGGTGQMPLFPRRVFFLLAFTCNICLYYYLVFIDDT